MLGAENLTILVIFTHAVQVFALFKVDNNGECLKFDDFDVVLGILCSKVYILVSIPVEISRYGF